MIDKKFFYFLLPSFFLIFFLSLSLHSLHINFLSGELGLLESTQILFIGISLFLFIRIFQKNKTKNYLIKLIQILVCLGCFVLLGEEISWGQHYFQWNSGAIFTELNTQNETNLHNISSWFDQKLKLLLEIGMTMISFIFPLLNKYNKKFSKYTKQNNFELYLANFYLFYTVIIFEVVRIIGYTNDVYPIFNLRFSELREFFCYYFIFLYAKELYEKIKFSK